MDVQEIRAKMSEYREYDVTRNEVKYRWDLGAYHVADKCYAEREAKWIEHARTRAAHLIAKMQEQRV